jgi:hypothetical protein
VDALVFPLILLALVLVVVVVGAPLRRGAQIIEASDEAERQRLEAARDAKYREIRELELDFRTGKLDEADFKSLDRQLRAEAVEILRELDALH